MTIMSYHTDDHGRLPVYENGRYRVLTDAEHAMLDGAETRAECECAIRHAALRHDLTHDPAGWAAAYVPHKNNANRVSYGRCDPDGGGNWPQRTDGTTP